MPLYRSPLRALAGFEGNNKVSARVFGAKGDGTTNDLAALQAAVDYIKTLPGGGGTLVLDGLFRITGSLQMDTRVSIEGVGSGMNVNGCSALYIDHNLNSMLVWPAAASTGVGYVRQRISNLLLGAKQANSGTVLSNSTTPKLDLILDNVTFNESPSTGLLTSGLWTPSDNSSLTMNNCIVNVASTVSAALWAPNPQDTITLYNTKFNLPTGYAYRTINMQGGRLNVFGCEFNAGSSPVVASASFVHTGAVASTRAVGNTFRGFDGVVPAFTWETGARLVESSNSYFFGAIDAPSDAATIGFTKTSGTPAVLNDGSSISTKPYFRRVSTSSTVLVDEYLDILAQECTGSTTVTFTLPRIYMQGQRVQIQIKNSTGAILTPVFSPYNPLGGTVIDIPIGDYAAYDFVAGDIVTAGTFVWYLVGVGASP
jgi:hypothetical protein